jgi:hypothetical protein
MTQERKLQSALIETGKEVEAIIETPVISDMETQLYLLKIASRNGTMKQMRRAARRLSALVIKFMIEKL